MGSRALALLVACAAVASTGCVRSPGPVSTGTPEVQITGISFTQLPASGLPNGTATACWRVEGNGTIPETALMTDTLHPYRPEHRDFAGPTDYPNNASGPLVVALPNAFCASVRLPASGVLYVSAYAVSTATKTTAYSELRTISVDGSADP